MKMKLNEKVCRWLKEKFINRVAFNELMSKHTTLKIGGPADAIVKPRSIDEIRVLIEYLQKNTIKYLVIGGGSNLLFSDKGFKGVIIKLARDFSEIDSQIVQGSTPKKYLVVAKAGARLSKLCAYALKKNLKGMNFALGIPGTVGGAIRMNAGSKYGAMDSVLQSVKIMDTKEKIRICEQNDLNFSYRNLSLSRDGVDVDLDQIVILEGHFLLIEQKKINLKNEAKNILKERKMSQPQKWPSAGCFFKNPSKESSAGQLIDLAGLKNQRVGDVQISSKHANFIINSGKGTAKDIIKLMKIAQSKVYQKYKIQLEPEVKIIE